MSTTALIIVAIAIGAMLGADAAYIFERNRSLRLSRRFGPDYSRPIAETGNEWKAESARELRRKSVWQLRVRSLDPSERIHFMDNWRELEARFIDNPNETLVGAGRLINRVMSLEGYPALAFEQQAADISVGHAAVGESHRERHRVAVKQVQGRVDTEDLRLAMLEYRKLFRDLVGEPN